MEIHHFSHNHPLVFKEVQRRESRWCDICRSPISILSYCCAKCNFSIHNSCSELPREIEHPCHPQHKLSLLPAKVGTLICKICGKWGNGGFAYRCLKCRFDIDLNCAHLTPAKGMSQQKIVKKLTHPHPLIICDFKSGFDAKCSSCLLPLNKAPIFVCVECRLFLDESCARLPQEIQHPFHKTHHLTLNPDFHTATRCYACGVGITGFSFNCLLCDFELDVVCASLMPIINDKSNEESDPKCVITHPHPLITCNKLKDYLPFSCSACLQPLVKEDAIYVCLDCQRLLHKSCACLPRQILEHPYHPEHILSLLDEHRHCHNNGKWYKCAACTKTWHSFEGYFAYKCRDCEFLLDSKCAFPVAPLVNCQLHMQHPLAFLEIQTALNCNACNLLCSYPFFKCLRCDFNLHAHCLPVLPPIVQHKCHLHPLTLTDSPVKDYQEEDDAAEFYCDACEDYRLLHEPTYYCAECHYVAHVHCVISEILPGLRRESSSLGDKLCNMKLHIDMDVAEDSAAKELKNDLGEEEIAVPDETIVDDKIKDDDLKYDDIVTYRSDDFSKETREQLETIVGDPVLAELDSNIATIQTGLDELKARLEVLTRQIETQTIMLEQLKESRTLHMLSQQQ